MGRPLSAVNCIPSPASAFTSRCGALYGDYRWSMRSERGKIGMLIQNRRCARDTLIVVIGTLLVASCGGSNAPPRYTVGGSVSGVVGSGLVLQDNGGNDLAIAANGSFLFSAALANASAYTVTIKRSTPSTIRRATMKATNTRASS